MASGAFNGVSRKLSYALLAGMTLLPGAFNDSAEAQQVRASQSAPASQNGQNAAEQLSKKREQELRQIIQGMRDAAKEHRQNAEFYRQMDKLSEELKTVERQNADLDKSIAGKQKEILKIEREAATTAQRLKEKTEESAKISQELRKLKEELAFVESLPEEHRGFLAKNNDTLLITFFPGKNIESFYVSGINDRHVLYPRSEVVRHLEEMAKIMGAQKVMVIQAAKPATVNVSENNSFVEKPAVFGVGFRNTRSLFPDSNSTQKGIIEILKTNGIFRPQTGPVAGVNDLAPGKT